MASDGKAVRLFQRSQRSDTSCRVVEGAPMESQPAQILVVDDEPSIRITLEALLRRSGYMVTLAATGEAALAEIERRRFDLLLLDLILPGINGHEVARYACVWQPAVAILILTGSDTLEPLDPGKYTYILKTASPQDVLARVAAVIAKQQAALLAPGEHHTIAS
jgi:DNA-binding response OmpR family regulator